MTDQIQILYDDRDLIVCVKPAGISAEADMPARPQAQTGAPEAIRCVHRLDTAVGGVMVYAKHRDAAAALSRAIAEGRVEKRYLAVCAGCPEPSEGVMRDLLFKDARKNKSYVVTRMRKGVREASLTYRVLQTAEAASLVEIRLQTGRSHQIRVQFASRTHPLLGDVKYGSAVKDCGIALWSCRLSFPHPSGQAELTFTQPPPSAWPWTLFSIGENCDAEL